MIPRVVFQGRLRRRGYAQILLELPPILHKDIVFPLQSYSKGARGLTV